MGSRSLRFLYRAVGFRSLYIDNLGGSFTEDGWTAFRRHHLVQCAHFMDDLIEAQKVHMTLLRVFDTGLLKDQGLKPG